MFITDEFLSRLLRPGFPVKFRGRTYQATAETDFAVGDVVLDRKDGAHCVIEVIIGERAALRDGYVVELNVPLSQLIKLKSLDGHE